MADVEMATETELSTEEAREYQRQRSNSDPQPAIEALNALNVQNALFTQRRWSPTMERRVLQSYLTLPPPHRHLEPNRYGNLVATVVPIQRTKVTNSSTDKRKNGEMKSSSLGPKTPPPERKSKFAALGKIFKPWKWKKKKKSENIARKAVDLERKISMRSTREELIRKGVLKESDDVQENNVNKLLDSVAETEEVGASSLLLTDGGAGCDLAAVASLSISNSGGDSATTGAAATGSGGGGGAVTAVTAAQVRPVVISMYPRTKEPPDHQPNDMIDRGSAGDCMRPQHLQIEMDSHDHSYSGDNCQNERNTLRCRKDNDRQHQHQHQHQHQQQHHQQQQQQDNHGTILRCHHPKDYERDENCDESPTTDDYDNLSAASEAFESIPACEPNLNLIPKKSALKRNFGVGGDPSLPSPTARCNQLPALGIPLAIHQHFQQHHHRHTHLPSKVGFSERPVQIIPTTIHTSQSNSSNKIPRPKLRVTVGNDSDKENLPSDVYYPDYDNLPGDDGDSEHDDDDDDDDYSSDDEDINYIEKNPNSLGAKVARHDSLARFLNNRPSRRELVEKNIIPIKTEKEKQEDREAIGTKLTRRLSLRPTPEELEQRNILHNKSAEEAKQEKEEKKRYLIRKLSFRPSIDELKERKIIKFNDYVEVTEAQDYDRRADKPWTRLTPKDKAAIRKELNEYKSKEMEVHEDSRHLTRFHRP